MVVVLPYLYKIESRAELLRAVYGERIALLHRR